MIKKNAITRYKILDYLLSNKRRFYSVPELVDRVNETLECYGMEPVSRRCIEKDLNTLSYEPYNAAIIRVTRDGKRCVQYEEDGFSIFTKKLSEDEENLLSEVLNTLGQFGGLDTFEWLDGLKNRLDIKEHRRIIQFDSNPLLANRSLIGGLFTTISNKKVISLKYHTFKSKEAANIIVHPHLLKQYNKRWFLIASKQDGAVRNFALDRIDGFTIMPKMKYIEPSEDLESRFKDIVGVTLLENKDVEDIHLWVSENSYQYVMTKPLHESQAVISDGEGLLREMYPTLQGGRFFKLQCIPNYELEQLLMSMMDQLVVLKPAALAESMKNRIKNLDALYSNI